MYGQKTKTDREEYLEYELERERNDRRLAEEHERDLANQREKERRYKAERSYRQASTWPEALDKQASLMCREYNQYPEEPKEEDMFWTGAEACKRALAIWPEEAGKVEKEIEQLLERVEKLRQGVVEAVGIRLEAEWTGQDAGSGRAGWMGIAVSLKDPETDLDSWLDW